MISSSQTIKTRSFLRLRMEKRLPVRRVAANILHNQLRTANNGWSSSLGLGEVIITLHSLNRESWYIYVRKTYRCAQFSLQCISLKLSSTCFEKWWNIASCLCTSPPDDEQLFVRNVSRVILSEMNYEETRAPCWSFSRRMWRYRLVAGTCECGNKPSGTHLFRVPLIAGNFSTCY